mmetsp:Transcript_4210/g.11448  ORF Transcript_4210/g.11448 Transcript_4210/m.11448 type:complete len:446 (-) Transcript_4210:160-1497(-)|eukprot:CAMPEP_0168750880 /NCGR_PEP_ID=MMETSP0724-20121128/17524_1 /TAXON_ID=265536 /ORGANISM="Amphiprora sp., Strain CCMP467" /LENGTH=445 /DNA_ID=CAMNT_0008798963 /DNA_START=26 /DNA_END=1363 /DNA_ORIENTATION=+
MASNIEIPRKVSLKILRAADLLAADYNITTEDSSDPYCRVLLGADQEDGKLILETPVQTQTKNPVWGGPLSLVEIDLEEVNRHKTWSPYVTVRLYDRDVLKSDDPLGQVVFHPGRIMAEMECSSGYPNVWRDVEPSPGCPNPTGRLQFRLLPTTEHDDTADAVHMSAKDALAVANTEQKNLLQSCNAGPKYTGSTSPRNKEELHRLISISQTPIFLHVYDVSNQEKIQKINSVTKVAAGGGIFHAAVQAFGLEYSFGGCKKNVTGVFKNKPRKCPMHHYRESIFLGDCDLSEAQVKAIIERMKPEWMGPTYNLLRKNCCSFSKEFAAELGVGNLPAWLYKFADYGARWEDYQNARKEAKEEEKGTSTLKEKEEEAQEEKSEKEQRQEMFHNTASSGELFEEGIEVSEYADSVIITPLDQIMAVRVQRAFRSSSSFGSKVDESCKK